MNHKITNILGALAALFVFSTWAFCQGGGADHPVYGAAAYSASSGYATNAGSARYSTNSGYATSSGFSTNAALPAITNTLAGIYQLAGGGGGAKDFFFSTSSGSVAWTNSNSAANALVEIWGGGGTGDNNSSTGGGGGAYCAGLVTLTPSQILSFTVGATDSDTTFTGWTAGGGLPATSGGLGGAASGATVNIDGGGGNTIGGGPITGASPNGAPSQFTWGDNGKAPGGGGGCSPMATKPGGNGGVRITAW